jgi:hypothetical protein
MAELAPLNSLLKASSKAAVEKCVAITFACRLDNFTVSSVHCRTLLRLINYLLQDCAEFIKDVLELETLGEAEEVSVVGYLGSLDNMSVLGSCGKLY